MSARSHTRSRRRAKALRAERRRRWRECDSVRAVTLDQLARELVLRGVCSPTVLTYPVTASFAERVERRRRG